MKTLKVELGEKSYPVFIGNGLFKTEELVKPFVAGRQILIVTNITIAPLYLQQVTDLFAKFCHVRSIVLADGEKYKTLSTANLIFDQLLSDKFERKCTLVALGGGVIGDITGFVAATYQRGINFIQIPTTLLSQVDSSVGGKTGVNHALGKNMIGAFYQPKCVLADLTTLKTLNPREIATGLAEVIKYGLINDFEFFQWLEQNIAKLLRLDLEALNYAVFKSCQNKANIVALDERESGIRATLNLGHTFGHAIESNMGYGKWLHGEAVGAGMVLAADLSHRLGWLEQSDFTRCINLIKSAQLPIHGPSSMTPDDYLKYMEVDKKVEAGKLKLILLKSIGEAKITVDFSHKILLETLQNSSKLS